MPGRGVLQRDLVRSDGERQQHEDEEGEGDDLPQRDARSGLYPDVLARNQHRVMPHGRLLQARVRPRARPSAPRQG